MNSSEVGNKPGRKRPVSDSDLPEEERRKKQRNREAAKKCRQKKQNQAEELKKKNQNLELENRQLADDKEKLEAKVLEYKKIIEDHINKGCEIPANVSSLWQLESGSNDMEGEFQAVAIMENRSNTPPTTPESVRSDTRSPPSSVRSADALPGNPCIVGLFGGNIMPIQDMTAKSPRGRTNSYANRPSVSSPSPPHNVTSSGFELTQFLESKTIPPALQPIQPDKNVIESLPSRSTDTNMNGNHASSLPTVVSEYEQDVIIGSVSQTGSMHVAGVDSHEVVKHAFAQRDILTNDPISNGLYQIDQGQQLMEPYQLSSVSENNSEANGVQNSSENLLSTGFSPFQPAPEGYSYAEDLCREEGEEEIIGQITSSVANAAEQYVSNGKEVSVTSQSVPNLNVQAQALLSLGEITPSLQRQIMTQMQTPSTTSAGQAYAGMHNQQQQLTTQQHVKQFTAVSPQPPEKTNSQHLIITSTNSSTLSGPQFVNVSEFVPLESASQFSRLSNVSQSRQLQIIRVTNTGASPHTEILNSAIVNKTNKPAITGLKQLSNPSSQQHVTIQKILPQTLTTTGHQQFLTSSTVQDMFPTTVISTAQELSQPNSFLSWPSISVVTQDSHMTPPSTVQGPTGTSSYNTGLPSSSVDTQNLPSLTFLECESDANIFEKKAKKSS